MKIYHKVHRNSELNGMFIWVQKCKVHVNNEYLIRYKYVYYKNLIMAFKLSKKLKHYVFQNFQQLVRQPFVTEYFQNLLISIQ